MKKIFALMLSLALVLSFCGCVGSEGVISPQPTEAGTENSVEKDYEFLSVYKNTQTDFDGVGTTAYYYAELEKVYLSEEDGAKYPALKNTLDEFNSENNRQWQESINDLKAFASDMLEMGSSALPLADTNSLSVQRADDKVLSLMAYNYWYSGGAHGYYSHTGVNFDVKTGRLLALNDIFKDTSGLCDIIVRKLRAKYTDMEFNGLEEIIESAYSNAELSYIVGYQGVTFCFSPYHLGSFADGEQFVTIYYDEYPKLFYEKYTLAPSSYVVGEVVSIDMNGDFKDDDFDAYFTYDGAMYIYANGHEYHDEDIYFDDADYYLIRNSDKYYIYTELSQENWKISVLYAIGENGIEKVQTLDATGLGEEYIWGEYCKKIPCDVGDILLKTQGNTLGLPEGNRSYFIDGESGILKTNE